MPDRKWEHTVRLGSGSGKLFCLVLMLGGCVFADSSADCSETPRSGETCEETLDATAIPIAPIDLPQPEAVDKRLFGVIPNYRADEMHAVYQPITTAEKYRIAKNDSFDWPNYFLLAGFALQAQLANGDNDGIGSFGRFYARALGDQIIGSYVTEAILPSLLHEDPRYFRLGTGTFFHRAAYATTRVFVTKLDNGKSRVYLSELAGNMAVVAITTSYYPDSRTAAMAAERYGLNLGNDALSNLLTEFWPDIKRRLPFRKHPAASPISAEALGGSAAGH